MLQLVIGLLILSGIAAFLALLLEIADRYIADYGESHILVNESRDLLVKGGSPLLFSLMEQGIFVPSACGGRGTCAYCKVKIREGGGPLLPTETPYLNAAEIGDQVRLACQVKVRNDLKIEIPEDLFNVREFRVRVERIRDLTPEIKELSLGILRPEEGITYKAGQYVQLQVPRYELTRGPEFRAYSISSPARDKKKLELIVARVPDGAVSTYVHDFLKEGEELDVIGPYGDFHLRESERDILLIATGSGLAPIMSILYQLAEERSPRKTTLFFGDRATADLFYLDRLKELEQSIPHFRFVATLSRADEDAQWQGERGRVTNLIERHIPDGAPVDAYICGVPAMVESCEALLGKKGIPPDRIFYDKFA